jgi:CHAT domain-containing protein/Tfp pilus assembly protein PilF
MNGMIRQKPLRTIAQTCSIGAWLLQLFFGTPAILLGEDSRFASERSSLSGIIVEKPEKGSTTERVGIRSGDVLLTWKRLPKPPRALVGASGLFNSVFVMYWLNAEQIGIGEVVIHGLRHGKKITFHLPDGYYAMLLRPNLPPVILEGYQAVKKSGKPEAARQLAELCERESDTLCKGDLAAWVHLKVSETLELQKNFDDAWRELDMASREAISPEAKAFLTFVCGKFQARRNNVARAAALMKAAASLYELHWGKGLGYAKANVYLAEIVRRQDNFPLAVELLRDSLERQKTLAPNGLAVSETLGALGSIEHDRGQLSEARKLFAQALEIRRRSAPGSHILAGTLASLGGLAGEQGSLLLQEKLLLEALKIERARDPNSDDTSRIFNNLGLLAWQKDDYSGAVKYMRQSLKIRELMGWNDPSTGLTLRNLGMLSLIRHDFDSAKSFLERALEISERTAPDGLAVAESKSLLATVLERTDLTAATDYISAAIEIYRRLNPGTSNLARALMYAGSIANARGDVEETTGRYQEALAILAQSAPESTEMATTLDSLGNIFKDRQDLDLAQEHYQKALDIRKRLPGQRSSLKDSYLSLGNVAMAKNDFESAIQYFRHVAEIEKDLQREGITDRNGGASLGSALCKSGRFSEGEAYLKEALKSYQITSPEDPRIVPVLDNLADAYLDRGEPVLAKSLLERSVKILRRLAPVSFDLARSLSQMGRVHMELGNKQLAGNYFRESVSLLEKEISRVGGSEDTKASYRTTEKAIYWHALEFWIANNSGDEAFRLLEQYRARSFLDQLATRDITVYDENSTTDQIALRKLRNQYDDLQSRLFQESRKYNQEQAKKLVQKLKTIRQEMDETESRIREKSPKVAGLRHAPPLSLVEAQQVLEPGSLLLSFAVGGNKTYVLTVDAAKGCLIRELSIGDQELTEEIRLFRSLLVTRSSRRSVSEAVADPMIGEARRLYKKLIEPLADLVEGSRRILVLPDGPLHLLPWGALIHNLPSSGMQDGRAWQYLAEWKPISIALSATVYAEIKKGRRDTSGTPVDLVAFGDPAIPQDFASRHTEEIGDLRVRSAAERGFDFSRLPATRHEVEQISQMFPGRTRLYLGADATEEKAKAIGKDVRYLHFATHGMLSEQIPLSSAVVLSVPEKFEEGHENGLLQAWEIFEQVRLDADLVVLSACESGLGKEMGGEGLIGLTRAFQYAGARSVMASLWKISDRTTAELMVRFYKHLKDGLPKDEALRAAQMELIHGPIQVKNEKGEVEEIDASAPYYWAAFQIYGDWQ